MGDREGLILAKHRRPKGRSARAIDRTNRQHRPSPSVVLVGTTAAALSTVLVFGHATDCTVDTPQVRLAAATIGIGGRGDPTSANVPAKLNGDVVPSGFTYIPVPYPAGFNIDTSVNAGVPVLQQDITDNSGQFLMVVGYSEGTIVAEKVRRTLDPSTSGAPSTSDLKFVMIASPNVPNGGIFGRFPTLQIPFFVTSNGAAQPSPYNTTYVTNEYDPYGDFPAYPDPLSLLNSLAAVEYVHPDQYYNSVDYNPLTGTGTTPVLVTTVTNTAGGTDTYVFVPAEHLPLLAPIRQVAGIVGLTPITEPVLDSVEPLLRVLIDIGYTDRTNANPETPTQFSLIIPPGRVLQAIAEVPGAIEQGLTNFVTGVEAIPGSLPTPLVQTPAKTSTITAKTLSASSQESSGTPAADTTVSTQSTSGPTPNAVTQASGKPTPNTGKSTSSSKGNPLTQLANSAKGLFSAKKAPASSTPGSQPATSAASGGASQKPAA